MSRVLVGFDGSGPARRALEHAVTRAGSADAEILVLTVIPAQVRDGSLARMMPAGVEFPAEMTRTFGEGAKARLDEIADEMRAKGAKIKTEVRTGDAATVFLDVAREMKATEIVIGHKAFEGPELKLGRNAAAILRGASIPVTVVH